MSRVSIVRIAKLKQPAYWSMNSNLFNMEFVSSIFQVNLGGDKRFGRLKKAAQRLTFLSKNVLGTQPLPCAAVLFATPW